MRKEKQTYVQRNVSILVKDL